MMWSRSQHRPQDPQRQGAECPTQERPAPFVLERRFEDVRQGGYFTPTAAVWISPRLRENGLLRDIAAEDLRLLLAVLSSVNPNGTFIATPELLAPALGLSYRATHNRLERLGSVMWNGQPLLTSHISGNGLHFFQPSPHLLDECRSVISAAPAHGGRIEPPLIASSGDAPLAPVGAREEVIAHSRATYTRPRAEVEAEINRFLSPEWRNANAEPEATAADEEAALPDTPEAREWLRLKRALVRLGVPIHRASALLETHPLDKIARQLEWLPFRQARNPAAYVVAAIEKDYAPPIAVSFQRAIGQGGAQATVAPDISIGSDQGEHLGEESEDVGIEIQGMDSLSQGAHRKEADETP